MPISKNAETWEMPIDAHFDEAFAITSVYWDHLSSVPELFGTLSVQNIRNKEVFSFAFEEKWLKGHPDFRSLDPDLQLYGGAQYTVKPNFGLFMDPSPDRWGRKLMGGRLSPVYDLNPNPEGSGLSLNITEDDNSLDFELALETAPYFRLNANEASAILRSIQQVVSNWRGYARRNGIANADMELMSPAFKV